MRTRAVQVKDCPVPASVRGRIERGIADLSGVALSDLPQTREEVEEISREFSGTAEAAPHNYAKAGSLAST